MPLGCNSEWKIWDRGQKFQSCGCNSAQWKVAPCGSLAQFVLQHWWWNILLLKLWLQVPHLSSPLFLEVTPWCQHPSPEKHRGSVQIGWNSFPQYTPWTFEAFLLLSSRERLKIKCYGNWCLIGNCHRRIILFFGPNDLTKDFKYPIILIVWNPLYSLEPRGGWSFLATAMRINNYKTFSVLNLDEDYTYRDK